MSKEIKIGENLLGKVISMLKYAKDDLQNLIPEIDPARNDPERPKQTIKDIKDILEVLNVLQDLESKDGEWTCPDCGSTWLNECPGCEGEAW